MLDLRDKRILVTGGAGFVGSFVVEKLRARGVPDEAITIPRSAQYDLRQREVCEDLVRGQDIVIHLAATVGGIGFNREHPGQLFYDNAIMGIQLMEAARQAGVQKFIQVGTICAYPKFTPVPFCENDLWIGYPEETNAPYGLAKKMLLVQAQAYRQEYGFNAIYLLPINLYGPRDNFDPSSSHVIPALIRKVDEAQVCGHPWIEVWGTGNASREFLYVEDAAEGIVLATERYDGMDPVNLGAGFEITIRELVVKICQLMNYRGEVRWNASKPDGQPRRMLNVSRAEHAFGFRARTPFDEGLRRTIAWYRSQVPRNTASVEHARQSVG
ncbi:GDP-L-fucose synthase [Candidatus Uhrbacteria bacterium]|nr:GDP-L-fucose synthase [Candidatus Uhrbacteria bacterium]